MLTYIMATGINGELGNKNKLLYHIKEDLKYFKKMTLNKTIIMGVNTFKSILDVNNGEPLKNRKHVILTTDKDKNKWISWIPNVSLLQIEQVDHFLENYKRLLEKYDNEELNELFVIGGAIVYNMLFDHCSKVLHTKIIDKNIPEYDTSFDISKFENWNKKSIEHGYPFELYYEINEYTRNLKENREYMGVFE